MRTDECEDLTVAILLLLIQLSFPVFPHIDA